MNVNLQSFCKLKICFGFFAEAATDSLSNQQKRIMIVAAAVFSFVAACYAITCCLKMKITKYQDNEGNDLVENEKINDMEKVKGDLNPFEFTLAWQQLQALEEVNWTEQELDNLYDACNRLRDNALKNIDVFSRDLLSALDNMMPSLDARISNGDILDLGDNRQILDKEVIKYGNEIQAIFDKR